MQDQEERTLRSRCAEHTSSLENAQELYEWCKKFERPKLAISCWVAEDRNLREANRRYNFITTGILDVDSATE